MFGKDCNQSLLVREGLEDEVSREYQLAQEILRSIIVADKVKATVG